MSHDPSKWIRIQHDEGRRRRKAEREANERQINERALAKRRAS